MGAKKSTGDQRPLFRKRGAPDEVTALGQLACQTPISRLMRSDITPLRPEMPASEAAASMQREGSAFAPVLTASGHVLGIATLSQMSTAASGGGPDRGVAAYEPTVEALMATWVLQLPESTSVARAATTLSLADVHHLVVMSTQGTYRGVLTVGDLLGWLAEHSAEARAGTSNSVTALETLELRDERTRREVLVVDDDIHIAEPLTELLEGAGYATSQAADGAEALRMLQHDGCRPDVILLDLMMPRMDGMQFRRAQLQDEALREIPVVVMSALTQTARTGVLAGLPSVAKPLRLHQLLDAVSGSIASPPQPG